MGTPEFCVPFKVKMQKGIDILDIDFQGDYLHVWGLVKPDNKMKEREFVIYPTGEIIKDYDKRHYHHIKTLHTKNILGIAIVIHVFEIIE
jgi:hypothetical protein